jgi:hypothetical protein
MLGNNVKRVIKLYFKKNYAEKKINDRYEK